jgi:NADH-quinone oxidoreductase subunit J
VAELLFYVLALGAVAFGTGVVAARMPLFSILSLLGSFFCLAGIYLLAGFQFLALTQLLVYAGAIMVLFLFVIMLLDLGNEAHAPRGAAFALSGRKLAVAGASAGALMLVGVASVGWRREAFAAGDEVTAGGIDRLVPLAVELFSRYLLPFEAASLLLLATMIAVIALAKRQRAGGQESAGWPWKDEVRR